MDCYQGIVVKN